MPKFIIIIIFLTIFSCNIDKKNSDLYYNPLDKWLYKYEDSLAKDFENFISNQNLKVKNNEQLISKDFHIEDSTFLGSLSEKIKSIDSNIIFTFQYLQNKIPKYCLHFNSEVRGNTLKTIDSLVSNITQLKKFTILKYIAPMEISSKYINEDEFGKQTIIEPDEVRFSIENFHSKNILNCYTKHKMSITSLNDIIYSVLGNEIILKQIDTIKYFVNKKKFNQYLTINQLIEYYKIVQQ